MSLAALTSRFLAWSANTMSCATETGRAPDDLNGCGADYISVKSQIAWKAESQSMKQPQP